MDLTTITTAIIKIGGSVMAVMLPVLITRAFAYFGKQNDASDQSAALILAKSAAQQVYQSAVAKGLTLTNVDTHSRLINQALGWIISEAPAGAAVMKQAGWDNDKIVAFITGELGHLLATDPDASATGNVVLGQLAHFGADPAPADGKVPMTGSAMNLGAAVRQAGIAEPMISVKKAQVGAFLLMLACGLSIAACSTPPTAVSAPSSTPALSFSSVITAAQPVIADLETTATALIASGIVPSADLTAANTALAALMAANAQLTQPGTQTPQQVTKALINAVNGVVQVIPSLPASTKTEVAVFTSLADLFLVAFPSG